MTLRMKSNIKLYNVSITKNNKKSKNLCPYFMEYISYISKWWQNWRPSVNSVHLPHQGTNGFPNLRTHVMSVCPYIIVLIELDSAWWPYDMEALFSLLAFCPFVKGDSPDKGPVMWTLMSPCWINKFWFLSSIWVAIILLWCHCNALGPTSSIKMVFSCIGLGLIIKIIGLPVLVDSFIIPSTQRSCWGVYWFHAVCPSVPVSAL